jgi:endonuclease YncB( thermonuclease family)
VRLKAVGIVAGGKWVQIQLPNENIAYVPRSAMALDAAGKPLNELEKVAGAASSVPNAASLVIGERTVRLAGVDAGPASALGPFETWVKGQGSLDCEPAAGTGAFRCYTGKGVDVGEAAILNGVARAGDGASALYRERETAAREAKKGLWGQP